MKLTLLLVDLYRTCIYVCMFVLNAQLNAINVNKFYKCNCERRTHKHSTVLCSLRIIYSNMGLTMKYCIQHLAFITNKYNTSEYNNSLCSTICNGIFEVIVIKY